MSSIHLSTCSQPVCLYRFDLRFGEVGSCHVDLNERLHFTDATTFWEVLEQVGKN